MLFTGKDGLEARARGDRRTVPVVFLCRRIRAAIPHQPEQVNGFFDAATVVATDSGSEFPVSTTTTAPTTRQSSPSRARARREMRSLMRSCSAKPQRGDLAPCGLR
jgi:hypothetical protein